MIIIINRAELSISRGRYRCAGDIDDYTLLHIYIQSNDI